MCRENWKKAILLGMAFCLCRPAVAAKIAPGQPQVTVAIHDQVGVSASALAEAERTAEAIFSEAGLRVELLDCEPAEDARAERACKTPHFPNNLHLTIAASSTGLESLALGVAYLDVDGTGCYSDVFFNPTEEVREGASLRLGVLLGHVMAHEIAHLLLGTKSHSETGIMRAHWSKQDLEKISKHGLFFTEAQGQRMRATVEADWLTRERESLAAKRATVATE